MKQQSIIPPLFSTTSLKNAYHYTKAFGIRNLVKRTTGMMKQGLSYNQYAHAHSVSAEELAEQSHLADSFLKKPVISIIVPTFNTPEDYLVQMIESVTSQSYPHWELCIADGSPEHTKIESVVRKYQDRYTSIRFKALETNLGIAGNTNAALALAGGDYIALLDHDDFLTHDALYEVARIINEHGDADVIYTDEDKYDSVRDRYYDPNFKPDFDQDYLRCCNYITHFYVVKKSIVEHVQGFSTTMDGSQDYDFILRTTEYANGIYHIPKVLYHWRIHSNSVAGDPTSKMYAYDAAELALNSHFQRLGIDASVSKTSNLGFYHTNYKLQGKPLISVVMNSCNPSVRTSILERAEDVQVEFVSRWTEMSGEYVMFLDHVSKIMSVDPINDYSLYSHFGSGDNSEKREKCGSQIITKHNWLNDLVSNCQRPEIGIVSGKILSSSYWMYEYGLIYDDEGRIVSPFYHHPTAFPGYYHLTDSQHCVSIVGSHLMIVSRNDLESYISRNHPCKLDDAFFYGLSMDTREHGKRITLLPSVCAILRSEQHRSFMFYNFDIIPDYILEHPDDPMYNRQLSVSRPYIVY